MGLDSNARPARGCSLEVGVFLLNLNGVRTHRSTMQPWKPPLADTMSKHSCTNALRTPGTVKSYTGAPPPYALYGNGGRAPAPESIRAMKGTLLELRSHQSGACWIKESVNE